MPPFARCHQDSSSRSCSSRSASAFGKASKQRIQVCVAQVMSVPEEIGRKEQHIFPLKPPAPRALLCTLQVNIFCRRTKRANVVFPYVLR